MSPSVLSSSFALVRCSKIRNIHFSPPCQSNPTVGAHTITAWLASHVPGHCVAAVGGLCSHYFFSSGMADHSKARSLHVKKQFEIKSTLTPVVM